MQPDGLGLFKVYCGIMAAMYALLVAFSCAVPLLDLGLEAVDLLSFLIIGLVSLPFAVLYTYGMFLPRAKWAWILGLIMIVIGMSSCCFWPICIPLLIKWIDNDFKAWFEAGSLPAGTDGW